MKLMREEKLRLVTGNGMWHTDSCNGKLPSIHLADGPHGLRKQDEKNNGNNDSYIATCFPTASAIACSWDTDVISQMAKSIAEEAYAEEVSILLGPGVNMKRSPLCGRNFEYFSEDPYLAGQLGSVYVKAVQEQGVGTSLKHFAGNSQETHRMTSNSQIDERTLREIYLSAFEQVVKEAKPATIMASYNRLNGQYACENTHILTEILRDEWEYEGMVVSDWSACVDLVKCIQAGMDLEMPDSAGNHIDRLKNALDKGEVSEEVLNRAVHNIQKVVCQYAIENRVSENSAEAQKMSDQKIENGKEKMLASHHKIARKLAGESAVLLKNEGILPLAKDAKVLVIGEMARTMRFQGGGSSHIRTMRIKSALEAMKNKGLDVSFAQGYVVESGERNTTLEEEALNLIQDQDTVLFFGGLTDVAEGEGYDRKTLAIPKNQQYLLNEVIKRNANVIFVGFSGAPYDMSFIDGAKAVLQMYLGGEAVGEACGDILVGDVNPSGKLAETFPLKIEDTPCYGNFATGSDNVEYRESIFMGYRYYDSYKIPVRFPFGYGLSYTSFTYSNLMLSQNEFNSEPIKVTFTITNTGNVKGKETAQLYVKNPKCNYLRANKELKGFAKVELEPGESKEITLILNERSFSIYDVKTNQWIVPSGDYDIQIGASIGDIRLQQELKVAGTDYEKDDREMLSDYFPGEGQKPKISQQQFATLYDRPLSQLDKTSRGGYSVYNSLRQLSKHSLLGKIVLAFAKKTAYQMYEGKPHDDPEVMMVVETILDGTIDGIVCQSGGMVPYKLAEAIVLSANGHPFQSFIKLVRRKSYERK